MRDQPVAKKFIEFSRWLFQAVQTPTRLAHVGYAVVESKGLSDVEILLNGCVHELCVDIKAAELKVVRSRDAEEDAELASRITVENVSM
jgi:hypothetical protein